MIYDDVSNEDGNEYGQQQSRGLHVIGTVKGVRI